MGKLLLGIYLSLAGGWRVHHFRQRFHRRWAADVVDLHPGRPGPTHGVLGVRRDRLAVSDLGRLVSLGATPHRQALGMDGRLGLCLGPVLHHGGRGHRRGAVSRATIRRRQHSRRDHHHCPCAHRHDHFFEPERDPPAGPGGDVRLHLRIGGGHRGRRLPTIVRSASAAQSAARHQPGAHPRQLLAGLSRLIACRDVLLLRFRGLRRCGRGNAERQPHDSQSHAHDHLHRRRGRHLGLSGVRAVDPGHRAP